MQKFSALTIEDRTHILLHQELEGCPDVGKYSKHSGKKSSQGVIRCVDKMKEGEVGVNER